MNVQNLTYCILFFMISNLTIGQNIEIEQLKSDFQTTPLGIDNSTPEFSWVLKSSNRASTQTAYEILISDEESKLKKGNFWKSGKIIGNQSFGISYNGKNLKSLTRYFWKIRVWNEAGKVSDWSQSSWFETSMLEATDWKASWISDHKSLPENDEDFYKDIPNPLFRKSFEITKEIKSARLYIAGLGYSITYINGARVGDHMLDMPWTQFGKQVTYNTFDVTTMLAQGENALGTMLGNGWYNPMPIQLFQRWNLRDYLTVGKPCLIAQLHITFKDGSEQTIATDDSWKVSDGPILMNSVYLGEFYDARLEQDRWNNTNFDDSKWQNAILDVGPEGVLIARYSPPVHITKVLKPLKMTEPKPGVYIFDFGQNFAGVPRLKVSGTEGTIVTMRSGEEIHPDGSLNYLTVIAGQLKAEWNLKGGPGCPDDPMMINTYVIKGDGEEVFTPGFTFSSFRYLEVTGFPGKPDLNSVEGLRMNSDLTETGSFECSNEMFNQIQEVTKWTFLSNVFSVQSDCPGREKLGYGADIVVTAEAFSFNYDMANFYPKVVQDFVNDVRPNGGMPEIAPNIGINLEGMGGETGPPGWQLAFPFGMKVLYDFYGDTSTIERNYPTLKRQVDFMHSVTPDHIVKKGISDHESIDEKPIALSATAFYYHHVKILIEFAEILNKENDLKTYKNLASDIKKTFIKTFLESGTGVFDNGTQAAQLISLHYNLVPEKEKPAAVNHLLLEIYNKHEGHLSTGIFATKFMFDFFRQENRNDIAYSIANKRTFPSWGNMLANGATTLYESWKYPNAANSQNHPMFGSISEWFYRSILGINSLEPGFRKFEIKPQPVGDLTWAKGYFDAVIGRITSAWEIQGTYFNLKVTVPANTSAKIYVPALNEKEVTENGKSYTESLGLEFIETRNGYAVFIAGAGEYSFKSKYQE